MAEQLNLEHLQGHKDFLESDLPTQVGWLDNFSGRMFREGRLDEALRVQDYSAQIQLQNAAQRPDAQIMQGLYNSILPQGGEREAEVVLGEDYRRVNERYSQVRQSLTAPSNILQVAPGEFVYTRKNPFEPGTLLELDGQTKFLDDGQANPEAIKRIIAEEKLPTVKKDKLFSSLVNKITPTEEVQPDSVGFIDNAQQLASDPEFQALSLGDQRNITRTLMHQRNNFGDQPGVQSAQKLLGALDVEYNAQQAMGQMASKDAPWYDFATTAIDRGTQRWTREWDRRAAMAGMEALTNLQNDMKPEQRAAIENNGQLVAQIADTIENAGLGWSQSNKDVREMVKGTELEAIPTSKLISYARAAAGYEKAEGAYVLRGKALSLIPQTEGMQQFQANQKALEDASWGAQAGQAALDIVSNPLDVILNATLESFVSQPISTAATAALFAIPGTQGVGGVAATRLLQGTGTGLIGAMTESSYTFTEELDKARVNADGTERPMSEVLRDPMTMQAVADTAILRGAALGTVEGVTGWILPGAMNSLDRFFVGRGARKRDIAAFNTIQAATQGVQEGIGETSAQLAASQDVNVGEVLLEMAAGMGGPDTLAMWQAPEQMAQARQDRREAATAEQLIQQAQAIAAGQAELSPEAVVQETEQFKGAYAQGYIPQIVMSEPDARGMADIEVFYEEDNTDGELTPIATEVQGLTEVQPEVAPAQEEATAPEQALQELPAEPIASIASIQDGLEISYLDSAGKVVRGPAKVEGDRLLVNDSPVDFAPNKFFTGDLKATGNENNFEEGDVFFDGNAAYRSIGNDRFIAGHPNQDGDFVFEPAEVVTLSPRYLNDPRVSLYAKPDFDQLVETYNAREDRTQKVSQALKNVPQKGQKGAQETPVVQEAPTTPESTASVPSVAEQAEIPIIGAPATKRRTTLFKLRAHKDMNTLLGKAVERFTDWMGRTKVLEQNDNYIRYAKDRKVHELHRQQAPETFDDTVRQLTEEDQAFKDQVEPRNWTEVEHYRKLEVFLKNRVQRTRESKNKAKRQKGILEDAQVSSILQALFIQDRAIAAYAGSKFGLYSPNSSLLTIEDVAELRYGNVEEWTNPNRFGSVRGAYDPMARVIQLSGNANVEDVFHELYHDFLINLAPLILTEKQYTRLQKFIDSRLAQTRFREYIKKNYRNTNGEKFADEDFTLYDTAGNLTIPAQEAFVQMMSRWHLDGRPVQGITPEDQGVLSTITNFYQQVFQDLGRTPIATTSDDAHDLLSNFWITPPSLRRQAFTPTARKARIDEEIFAEDMSLEELSAAIGGRNDTEIEIPEEQTLPAPPQIVGDRLVDTYRPDEAPREGVPFTSAGRTYVLEEGTTYEIISTPAGLQKIPRETQEQPWDGQTEFPPVEGTGVPAGTQEVRDENIPMTAAPEAGKKPVIKTVIPVPETNSTRTILTDPETGMVISDKTRKNRKRVSTKKAKTWNAPEPNVPPENRELLYSIEDDTKYQMGRMNRRLLADGFALSRTLKQIAQEENRFKSIPNKAITDTVEQRMNGKVTILDALRDIYKLRRMSPDRRTREFGLQERYEGGGTAALIYYLLALQSRLNLVLMSQDNGQDLDIDRNTAQMLLGDVTRAVALEQREAGRAVNINKMMLIYSPDAVIERLESDLVRNNAAFKSYVRRALAFGKKYRGQQLTDSEFQATAKLEGFPASLTPALRLYSKDSTRSIRDFELDAARAWAKDPGLEGYIKPETKALIRDLRMAAESSSSPWMRDFYAQQAKLATEAERGTGIIDSLNGMMYNNMLAAFGTSLVNILGSSVRMPLDFFSYYLGFTAIDVVEGRGATAVQKNTAAILKGMQTGVESLAEAFTEFKAIALSGQRGTSVEAFTKGIGTIATTQTALYGRQGTSYADRTKATTVLRRLLTIALTDLGRRNATAFDAFFKVFSENSYLGMALYREAWDTYQAEKPAGISRSQFIENHINANLNIKPLEHYQTLADQELRLHGDLIMKTSISTLPKKSELATLRNVIAFNLRREEREMKITPEIVGGAKTSAFATSFSNETRGMAAILEETLGMVATLGPISKNLGEASQTHVNKINVPFFGETELRWRVSAGGSVTPFLMPFSGNIARMAEEFFNWTGLGTVHQAGVNYFLQKRGKTESFFENYPDAYTKIEMASSFMKGVAGMATLMVLMGSDEEDEDKPYGISGYRSRSFFGRNGKETFVPPYSIWWRTRDGKLNHLSFKEYPQLVASVGTAATYNERRRAEPDAPWPMMLYRLGISMTAGSSETGMYDGVTDLAAFVKEATAEGEKDSLKIGQGIKTNFAKYARSYFNPLNRLQKETMLYSLLPGRDGSEVMPAKEFFPTLYANTILEGWLSPEDKTKLDKIVLPDGTFKQPDILDRVGGVTVAGIDFGSVLKAPSPAIPWMVENNYVIQRSDHQKAIQGLFTKKAQKEKAEAIFSEMNNGMFFTKHASEIESRAMDVYWPWLEGYKDDAKRREQLESFVNSETNALRKRQGSSQHKTLRELQQADINKIVTTARNIASLQVAGEYYTDDPKIQRWVGAISAQKQKQGYSLADPKVNRLLEQGATQ